MARKSKTVVDEIEVAAKRLKELEALVKVAQQEEEAIKQQVQHTIDSLCESNNYFCGVILTPKDLASIVQMAIEKSENIQIPYQIYYKD